MGILQYADLMAQAGLQNCDPMNSACVSNNVAKEAAVEDYWAAHQATGVPEGTVLSFTPQTTQEVTEFYNPANLNFGGNVVDTRGIMQVSGPPAFQTNFPPSPPPAPPKPAVTTPPQSVAPASAPAPGTPGGATVINSSGVIQPVSSMVSLPSGFSFSSIPIWGWALAGGAALYAFGGSRGR